MPAMIKLALPAGDLRSAVAVLLDYAGLAIEGYGEGSRAYRLPGRSRDVLTARVFREKDIPIQVALGNYALGICSIAWVKEMRARFPGQPIVPLSDLGVAQAAVWAAGAPGHCDRLEYLPRLRLVRIASEYANIAEAFARSARLARYRVQPVWGAAEAYPPEDADCVIVTAAGESQLRESGAQPLFKLFDSSAWLVANATALKTKNLSSVTGPLKSSATSTAAGNGLRLPGPLPRNAAERMPMSRDTLRLAVPDGHQQRHVVEALRAADLVFDGYGDGQTVRRPPSGAAPPLRPLPGAPHRGRSGGFRPRSRGPPHRGPGAGQDDRGEPPQSHRPPLPFHYVRHRQPQCGAEREPSARL